MLPPESEPIPNPEHPAATAAASPPLDPPGVRVTSYGFEVRPKTSLTVSSPPPHGGQLVLPTTTAPADRSRATTTASLPATMPTRSGTPATSGSPATPSVSLTVKGTPQSGPAKGSTKSASATTAFKASAVAEIRSTHAS